MIYQVLNQVVKLKISRVGKKSLKN